jgi:hypothetical protein
MATDLALAMQISANTTQLASAARDVSAKLQGMAQAGRKASADLAVLKTIEISRVFVSSITAATRSLSAIVSGSAAAIAGVDDLSNRTGVSVQSLQAYQFAAEQSGVSVETFGRSVQKLGINLGEAQTGNKAAARSFADLGLSVDELTRLSPEAAFEAVSAAIAKLPNPAQQAAAAVSVFGKAGAELVPVFAEGAGFLENMRAEAVRLGLVLGDPQVRSLAALDDSLEIVSATFRAFTARVAAELAPALVDAAENAATFIASLDVRQIATSITSLIGGASQVISAFGEAFLSVYQASAPLAATVFPAIANSLSFIAKNLRGAAVGALAAAGALAGYSLAGLSAAAATAALSAAITTLLSRTGIGLIVVLAGAAAGALLNWASSASDAGADSQGAIANASAAIAAAEQATRDATQAVREFGDEATQAFKLPAEITERTLVQDGINEASTAFRNLAKEAGGLANVPVAVGEAFETLTFYIEGVERGIVDSAIQQEAIAESAAVVLVEIQKIVEARKAEEEATKAAAQAAQQASDAARKRTEELASAGVSAAEQSRVQLSKDLLAITQSLADAEAAVSAAKQSGDRASLQAAQERLRLTQETAAAATIEAKRQARERDLAAFGIDEGLLKPVTTLRDQFVKVREAFDRGLVNGGEARQALKNLAAEGVSIRADIAAELSRPAQRALSVNDLRTAEGASQFLALATGREDPAIEQARQQVRKLDEIKQALIAIGANPVEIIGG